VDTTYLELNALNHAQVVNMVILQPLLANLVTQHVQHVLVPLLINAQHAALDSSSPIINQAVFNSAL